MRRWPTWRLVGALAALGAVAAADALRGTARETVTRPRPDVPSPITTTRTDQPSGVLYYSESKDDCRLHGVGLPGLENAPPPQLRSCEFALAPDGTAALPGEVSWSPRGGLYASESAGMIELGSPASAEKLRFPGTAPAFTPAGEITYVRGRSTVVRWTSDCREGERLFTLPGDNATARCRKVVLSAKDLARARISGDGGPLVVHDAAWLSDSRLVAVLGDSSISGYREHVAVFEEGSSVGVTLGEFGEGLRVETSPRGSFFTAWYGHNLVEIRDRDGDPVPFPRLSGVHAVTWSPDERWTAAATEFSVFLFPTDRPRASVRRLPIAARDLAWR